MRAEDRAWLAYIEDEVRAVCDEKGWGHQIRRRWSARERPVSDSPIEDYEWKLLPGALGKLPETSPDDFEGRYYVPRFDRDLAIFVLQHDTSHVGEMGPHWELETYTEISMGPALARNRPHQRATVPGSLPVGWLRDHLGRLVTRFGPNSFSRT